MVMVIAPSLHHYWKFQGMPSLHEQEWRSLLVDPGPSLSQAQVHLRDIQLVERQEYSLRFDLRPLRQQVYYD